MKCPHCGFDHPASRSFCGRCGARLGALCPRCGAEAPESFRFCGECGTPLTAATSPTVPSSTPPPAAPAGPGYTPPHLAAEVLSSPTAVAGERKPVTVLFCDLVESTALAERVGAETMHSLLNRFFEMALAEVHRYEGTLNQFLGDGFMALFGAPVAHEDHARRAVLAALGLRERLAEHRDEIDRRHGIELKVRMGLNTGLVVVGGIGDHLRMDYTAVGDTTHVAARLQSLAEPGEILISEATWRKVEAHVKAEALPPTRVKGKEEPIRPYRVLEARRRPAVRSPARRSLSPFVGRERELAVLEDLWDQAASGHGQVVGITGEAGSGKSRFLQELRRRRAEAPVTRLFGRCLSYGSGIPYLPLIHMLRTVSGISETDPPETVREKVGRDLARFGIDDPEAVPLLLHLLGVRDGTEALADLEPQVIQSRTFATLLQILYRASERRPVIFEVEDLQWMDATSEAFLARLVQGMAGLRLLLLTTYRTGCRPPWMDSSWATQLSMQRLTAQESGRVVTVILDRAGLDSGRAGELLAKAEGNPFFLEELAWSLAEDRSGGTAVPDTVQEVLLARIDRLPEEHKQVLLTASVLGRELSSALLAAVWTGPPLEPLLAELERQELLFETPTEPPTLHFHHALIQEVAYQSLLTGRRQALHRAAGQALESLYAEHLEEAYDRLAYHFSRADTAEQAVTFLRLFAEQAARGWAHAEAAAALREALEQAGELPEESRDRRTLDLVLRLAESLLPLAQIPETLELLERHGETVERLGECSLTGPYFFWLAHTHSYLGHQDEAARHARRALEEVRDCGDTATQGKACYVLSRNDFWAGRFREGLAWGLKAVELLETAGERWWKGQALWVNGFHCFVLGQHEAALTAMGQAREIGEALDDYRLDTSWSTGYFLASLGDWEAGIAACQGGLERARDPLNSSAALGFLGYAYLEQGDLEQAVATLEQAVARLKGTGMQQLLGWFSVYLAEAYLAAGERGKALPAAEAGLAATREADFRLGEALAVRALGRITLAGGDAEQAQRRLEDALERFETLEVPLEAARTRVDLARWAQAQGQDGSDSLARAQAIFSALGVDTLRQGAGRFAETPETERKG